MTSVQNAPAASDLEAHRGYLLLLASVQLSPRLRAKEDAADIVQMTLLEAHRDLPAYRGSTEAELLAWLKTILTRNLLNLARHYAAQKCDVRLEQPLQVQIDQSSARLDRYLASEQTTPSQCAVRRERAEELNRALGNLLDDERTAVLMKHFHDRTIAEIAAHLGRTKEAVGGLLRRGMKKLRTHLDEAI
jgi:RNA polymerase sigma-70 factor (ECF subfamily)